LLGVFSFDAQRMPSEKTAPAWETKARPPVIAQAPAALLFLP
jgi:hypothetical protein